MCSEVGAVLVEGESERDDGDVEEGGEEVAGAWEGVGMAAEELEVAGSGCEGVECGGKGGVVGQG